MSLAPTLAAADVLARWPETAAVFFARKLGCVGCAMAPFDTLADIARSYHLDLDAFVADLEQAITKASPGSEILGQ